MSIGWHTAEKGFLGRSIAGACATFSGIGLGRFGYVPLFPAMVLAGWIEASEAGLLGAANLAGYLAGALGGRAAARQVGVSRALDLGMLATALSFAACAFDGGFLWLTAWRAIAGASGGVLMALAGPAVQETTEPNYRSSEVWPLRGLVLPRLLFSPGHSPIRGGRRPRRQCRSRSRSLQRSDCS